MSIQRLQQKIRKCKTPVALGLRPEAGQSIQAHEEKFRRIIETGAGRLPAVYLGAEQFLEFGPEGFAALQRMTQAAAEQGYYVIADCRACNPEVWLKALPAADGLTVMPYMGPDCCEVGENKAAFAVVRTANRHSRDVQKLVAGDRRLYEAIGAQMSRHGAGLVVETGGSKDVKELVRRLDHPFVVVTNADHDKIAPIFDDFGHGGLIVDHRIQNTEDPNLAIDQAVEVMKQWVTVL